MVHSQKIANKEYLITYDSLFDVFKQLEEKKELLKNSNGCWNDKKQGYDYTFYYYKSFDEALEHLKSGWEDGAKKIFDNLSKKYISDNKTKMVSKYDVVGFQASVPRYLQGIPTNMINQKRVPNKQKVITIVKHVGFLGNVSETEIIENSVKALAIVKKIEEQGIRCNVDVISPVKNNGVKVAIRIRIKNSSERLNIGKLAFAIANPDMLRRIIFALRYSAFECGLLSDENVNPFTYREIGATIYERDYVIKNYLKAGEKYLHNFIDDIDEEIKAFNEM